MLTDFSSKDIVSLLQSHTLWAKRACREIQRRKDEFVPLLIDILDEAITDPKPFVEEEKCSHIPAAFLLAQLRVTEAYPRLVSLIRYDEETVDSLWGDILMQSYPIMLRDTFNGDAFLLPALIEDRSVSEWARAMAIHAWAMHFYDGFLTREEICGCFRRLIHEVYNSGSRDENEAILACIVNATREYQLEELIEDVKSIFARGGIDESFCGSFEEYLKDFKESVYRVKDVHISDAIASLEEWQWFTEKYNQQDDGDEGEDDLGDYTDTAAKGKLNEIGRNDPCPCHSGRKYKNCCLRS